MYSQKALDGCHKCSQDKRSELSTEPEIEPPPEAEFFSYIRLWLCRYNFSLQRIDVKHRTLPRYNISATRKREE
jgi:hypothetical protein